MVKVGYVGIIGLPNAGKSTLVNRLVGEKVAIVSSKPQTTRENIVGIVNGKDYQIILVDTPGVHHSKNKLDKYMMKNVRSTISGADVIVYLLDGTKQPDREELEYIEKLKSMDTPVILVSTKSDRKRVCEIGDLPVSSLSGEGIEELKNKILEFLPLRDGYLYDRDYYTTQSIKNLIGEKLREECLNHFKDEIPHGIAVEIIKFVEQENLVTIDADIICEQERHKGIIIGKGGTNLKNMGQSCRKYAEEILDKKVYLNLFVKVEKDWRNNPNRLKSLGFD